MSDAPALWPHQEAAIEFARARRATLLHMWMGCLAGDTEINYNRGGNERRARIDWLVAHEKLGWDRTDVVTRIRCLKADGTLGLARLAGVRDTGARETFELRLRSGRTLRATGGHEIVTPMGKVELRHLRHGDEVLAARPGGRGNKLDSLKPRANLRDRTIEGLYVDRDGYVRVRGVRHHRETTGGVYEHILVAEKALGRPILRGEVVHHINGDKRDSRAENLEVLTSNSEHAYEHSALMRFNLPGQLPDVDIVESARPTGLVERVYDLSIDDEAHTYVANGIVVGNTGKSRVALEVARRSAAKRVLVLAPLAVVDGAWGKQFAQFAPEFSFEPLADGSCAKRAARSAETRRQAEARGKPLALAVNHDAAWRPELSAALTAFAPDLLVCDELHRFKQFNGKASTWLGQFARRAPRVLGLTGTPCPHSPLDVWAQFRALDPSIFGGYFAAFRARYAKLQTIRVRQKRWRFVDGVRKQVEEVVEVPKVVGFQRLDELREKMAAITFQAGPEVLDLPHVSDEDRAVDLGPEAARAYRTLKAGLVVELREGKLAPQNALVKLLRLQQLAGGWAHVEGADPVRVGTEKRDALADFLEDVAPDEPVVVFARFSRELDDVHAAAESSGRTSLELSGRRKELAAWQAGAAPVLAVQLQAGGVGIDLTRARLAVYYSTGLSLGDHEQSRARLHRPGQTRNVAYYYLSARGTVDETILRALRARRDVLAALLEDLGGARAAVNYATALAFADTDTVYSEQ